ncbi:MAG: sulfatase/phosphatase domain-containing protein [Chloroflexota bacterium]
MATGLPATADTSIKAAIFPMSCSESPLAIRYPAAISAKQTSHTLVSNLDFAPTMLDFADTSFDGEVHGQSLRPLFQGKSNWRTDLMCQTNGHDDNTIGRALITNRYKYIATQNDLHELYDLHQDPYELTNLLNDPAHVSTLNQLQQKLRTWQNVTQDSSEVLENC